MTLSQDANGRTDAAISFLREPLANILESGVEALLLAHWQEVAHDRDVIALRPDWRRYLADEEAGNFIAYTLRRGAHLIGYNAFFLGRNHHYMDHVFAVNDVIYLRPEERGADGLRMIILAEKEIKALGVSKIFYHIKADHALGSPDGDSLTALEGRLELEELLGRPLRDDFFQMGGNTVGAALAALGYSLVEHSWGRLLTGAP